MNRQPRWSPAGLPGPHQPSSVFVGPASPLAGRPVSQHRFLIRADALCLAVRFSTQDHRAGPAAPGGQARNHSATSTALRTVLDRCGQPNLTSSRTGFDLSWVQPYVAQNVLQKKKTGSPRVVQSDHNTHRRGQQHPGGARAPAGGQPLRIATGPLRPQELYVRPPPPRQ